MANDRDWMNNWHPTNEELKTRDEQFEAQLNADREERGKVQDEYDNSQEKPKLLDWENER